MGQTAASTYPPPTSYYTSQEDSLSEEEPVVQRKKTVHKSDRDRTGATSIKKRITWPHEVIYGADSHPATYKKLTVSSFVTGYLIVLNEVQVSEIKDRMVLHLEEICSFCLVTTNWASPIVRTPANTRKPTRT